MSRDHNAFIYASNSDRNGIVQMKKRRGEKAKSKSQDCCVTFKPKNLEILLYAHARTSQADILHLDQKAVKCTTCKPVCGKF